MVGRPDRRPLRIVRVSFETTRFSAQHLIDAYACLVPTVRRTRTAPARDKVGRPLVVLAATTSILPDDTYLTEMELRQRKLTLSGRSAGAARLIGALAGDAEFRNPGFSAPVTRLEALRAELFTINAEVTP